MNHSHEWPLPGQAGVLQLSLRVLQSFILSGWLSKTFELAIQYCRQSVQYSGENTARACWEATHGPRFHRDGLMSARRMQQARSGDRVSGRPQMMSIMSPGIGHHLGNRPSDSTSRKLLQRIISAGRALSKAIHSSLLCHGVVPTPRTFFACNAAVASVKPTPVMS